MLRITRILLAIVSLAAMTWFFVDFTGTAASVLSFLPKVQFVPALLALNFVAIAFVVVLSLVFGRIYCSVLCPLGIFQDAVSRIRQWLSPKNTRRRGLFGAKRAHTRLRVVFLCIFALAAVLALTGVLAMSYAGLLEPYSIFGRFAGQILAPAWHGMAVPLGNAAADHGIWLFDSYPAPSAFSWAMAAIATVQILLVAALAWWRGRIYCNSVCPVGTALGYLSRYSLMKVTIDTDKCISCGKCAKFCKAECINPKKHAIDYTRCVACMDCIGHCSVNALGYRISRPAGSHKKDVAAADTSRRAFLVGAGIAGGALIAGATEKIADGGFAPIKQKKSPEGIVLPVPAGAISIKHFSDHCTACQLCVSECPQGILKPQLTASGFMQPRMEFTAGYCLTECTRCSDVCPAGAITPVDAATKSAIKIGTAVVDTELCISASYGQHCGNCARNCPVEAITMVQGENGNLRPAVNGESCIGCGKCEYVCPVGTAGQLSSDVAAIRVEGIEAHIIR